MAQYGPGFVGNTSFENAVAAPYFGYQEPFVNASEFWYPVANGQYQSPKMLQNFTTSTAVPRQLGSFGSAHKKRKHRKVSKKAKKAKKIRTKKANRSTSLKKLLSLIKPTIRRSIAVSIDN